MPTLDELTVEHIGGNEADLEQFRDWAHDLMDREGICEEDAIELLLLHDDPTTSARYYGLAMPEDVNRRRERAPCLSNQPIRCDTAAPGAGESATTRTILPRNIAPAAAQPMGCW